MAVGWAAGGAGGCWPGPGQGMAYGRAGGAGVGADGDVQAAARTKHGVCVPSRQWTGQPAPPLLTHATPSPRACRQMVGVGYKAAVSGSNLTLNLGYSHPIEMPVPKGLAVRGWRGGCSCLRGGSSCWGVRTCAGLPGARCPRRARGGPPPPPCLQPPTVFLPAFLPFHLLPSPPGQGGEEHHDRGVGLRQGAGAARGWIFSPPFAACLLAWRRLVARSARCRWVQPAPGAAAPSLCAP